MIKDIARVLGSGVGAQAIYLCALPLIARLYGPSEYAPYGIFVALLNLSVIGLTLKWEIALAYKKESKEIEAFVNSFWVLILFATFLGAGALSLSFFLLDPYKFKFALYILISAVTLAIYNLLEMYLVKVREFLLLAVSRFCKVISLVGLQLLIPAIMGESSWDMLVVSHFISMSLGVIILFLMGSRSRFIAVKILPSRRVNIKESIREFKAERTHLYFNAPQAFLNSLSKTMPYLVLPAAGGASIIGIFSMADRLIRAPLSVVSNTIKQVVTVSAGVDLKEAYLNTRKMVFAIAIVSLPLLMVSYIYIDMLAEWIFGHDWRGLGTVIWYLCLYAVGSTLALPYLAINRALKYHKALAMYELLSMVLKALTLALVAFNLGTLAAIKVYGVLCLLIYLTFAIVSDFAVARKIKLQ
ncbi:oligosaccharide flippase family protein [Alcanivorax sp. JB21]|uniref:lipopolysaccharide biosynthesis protein n=1 Tax=Alcanivorax limicola TaxID=2874102 RepID=UPI001CBCACEA|nr:oligosaccharide flippase family protein [Alcanivorax limicola]MBZ2188142.1 oligosaccharide flippase family protein [Alcanivorax limicola]